MKFSRYGGTLKASASLLMVVPGAAWAAVDKAPPVQTEAPLAPPLAGAGAQAAPPSRGDGSSLAVPTVSEAAQQDADGALADIVVTAQRRSENLQRVPLAITAVSGETLQATAITSTIQLSAIAPGLNIRTNNGAFTPYLRGIGTSSNLVENPVALYIDGVYLPQQREGLRELNDIEQVAVLKGPQGTLFGRNATGGVIQITTRAPSRTFRAEAGVELDNYLTLKTDAYVSGPISETVAYSVSGQYARQFDGYGENLTTGHDNYQLGKQISLRGKLLFEPGDRTTFTLIADYIDREARMNSFRPLLGTRFSVPGFGPSNSRYDIYAGVDPFANFEGGGVSLTSQQEFDFARLLLISAYRRGANSTLQSPSSDPANSFFVFFPDSSNETHSEEVQLLSKPGRFNWVVGAFYFYNRNVINPGSVNFSGPFAPAPASPRRIDNFGTETAESIAPFGQFNFDIWEGTTLTGGIRWTYERRSAELTRVINFNNGRVARPPIINDSVTFREPTYRVALSHEFAQDVLGYVSFNTGFKSGGFNIVNRDNPAYLPEKLKSYEIGVKSQFAERRVRLNVAAYYYDYTNVQVARFSNGTQTVTNGAAAKLYGLEADLEAQVDDNIRLSGGLALEHTEFTSFLNAVIGTPQPNGSVVLAPGDAKGNRLPLAQEVQTTLGVYYKREFGSGTLNANLIANYNGPYFFEPDNGVLRQGAYVMLNSTLKFTLPGDRLSFSVFGKNLLNETIIASPTTQTFGYDVVYAPPRTYGVAVRIKF